MTQQQGPNLHAFLQKKKKLKTKQNKIFLTLNQGHTEL